VRGKDRFPVPTSRVDERDTMFARMARHPGTTAYEDYYERRADLHQLDDRIRALPRLGKPGGFHYDEEICAEAEEWFSRIGDIRVDASKLAAWRERLGKASRPTRLVKEMVLSLGAVAAGCAPLDEAFLYTHKGRFDRDYGNPVELDHPSVLVFLVEMDHEAMQRAPRAEVIRESARQYYRAALIAKMTETVLAAAGYQAKAHYDANYDLILPPLAVRAGLGEMGRHNILIAGRFGTRVRIGAVSTDFPLDHDRPVSLGARRFCGVCKKCADNCPSHALSADEPVEVRGVEKWPTHIERCYRYWRRAGTDCGVCMACCPYSHPDNAFHNLVRFLVRHMPWAHRALLWCDDLVYGRRWKGLSDKERPAR
jgi:reductive dehalogenase